MKRLTFILGFISFVGCYSDKHASPSALATLSKPSASYALGKAYFSAQRKVSDARCMSGSIVESRHNKSIKISIGDNLSADEIRKSVGGQLLAKALIGPLQLGVNGHVSKEMAASDRVSNQFIQIDLKGPSLRFATNSYIPTGEFLTSYIPGDQFALSACGDGFVASVDYGADISVGMKIEFLSEEQKDDIGGDIFFKQGIPIIDLGLSVEAGANVYEKRIHDAVLIKVSASQTGGKPLKLLQALPSSLVQCSLEHLDPCVEFIQAIMAYANSDFMNQFDSLDDYVVKSMGTIAYNELPLLSVPGGAKTWLNAQRLERLISDIEDEVDQTNSAIRRSYSLLNHYSLWLTEDQLKAIKSLNLSLLENRSLWFALGAYCRKVDLAEDCQLQYDERINDLRNVDLEALSISILEALPEEQCKNAITVGVEQGVIKSEQAAAFIAMKWAPIYFNNDETSLGVRYWSQCHIAVESYGHTFRRLYNQ